MVFLSNYCNKFFINLLKYPWKLLKTIWKVLIFYKSLEQLIQQNAKRISLSRILGVVKALLEFEKRKRKGNKVKAIKNLFRLWKEIDKSATKDIRNLFRLRKENETIKDKIIRGFKISFEEKIGYYQQIKVGNLWNNNYIEDESDTDKNKNLSVKECLNEIKLYLKDIISDL